ncbi:MAG TPA: CGNR zinc finger domain-containing protein [Ktedonobacteraceae bacterium]|nr:CGNR zinc finger domain-containing protein [Ktedonobacteraceae bacterium]
MSQSQHNQETSPSGHTSPASPEHTHLISEGELCLDLINSIHFDYRGKKAPQDHLEHPAWVQEFSQHWHLPVTAPPDTFALVSLRTLRALLRHMVETADQPPSDTQITELNSFLALTPMLQQVQRTDTGMRLQIVPLQTGWTAVLTQIAASWADLLTRTPSVHVKICANPACHWVFVDQSHNQSRRWCRQWACGNLMKVRQFRAQRSL